jgi:ferredoxin/flavodoxin
VKIVLVYISPNKTTQMITKELSSLLLLADHEVVEVNIGKGANRDFKSIDPQIFNDADLIGIGSPVYHMRVLEPMTDFLEYILPKIIQLNEKVAAFIYLTYGGITTGKALINTANLLEQYDVGVVGGFKVYAPHFWDIEGYPDDESLNTIQSFYSAMCEKNFKQLESSEVKKIFSYQKPIVKIIYPLTEFIGKLREKQVEFDTSKCIQCRKCSRECPVDAIEMNVYPERNKEKCIYCYHCTTVCPKDAVIFNDNDIKAMLAKNKKIVGLEYPKNEIYY